MKFGVYGVQKARHYARGRFQFFGNGARTILQGEVIDEVLGNLPDKPMPIELGACEHCSKDYVPEWRRGGSIVRRTWPDGRAEWCCHCCGRVAKEERKIDES